MNPWRACIALVMAALFAMGSLVSANPQWHAAWHHHEDAEASATCATHAEGQDEVGHECEHDAPACDDHSCFLCALSSGSVWMSLPEPLCSPTIEDSGRVQLVSGLAVCKPSDRLLPPILGPPSV